MMSGDGIGTGYDFVVCGAGTAGSVVAGRLAEDPSASVLLLEAGGWDDCDAIHDPERWQSNLGTDRDWNFDTQPESGLGDRSIPYNMGRVVGGGSAINACLWVRGHRLDWDHVAAESGDARWAAASVRALYDTIEHRDERSRAKSARIPVRTWSSHEDDERNGPTKHFLAAADASGLPVFDDLNGAAMDAARSAARAEVTIRHGRRTSMFDAYVRTALGPNLVVLTRAFVTRIVFDRNRATHVEFVHDGRTHSVEIGKEIVVSAGAVQTPALLMRSGIGDEDSLRRFGIPVVSPARDVGRNLQNHILVPTRWKGRYDPAAASTIATGVAFAFPADGAPTGCLSFSTPRLDDDPTVTLTAILVQPSSRGEVQPSGIGSTDPLRITPNALLHSSDLAGLVELVRSCRDLGASEPMRQICEPGTAIDGFDGDDLLDHVRRNAAPASHQCGTCRMGRDAAAVVDRELRLTGTSNVRVADASVLPRITVGNTMAPCVVVGERAASFIKAAHGLALQLRF